jgi:hypothetical protein
MVTIKVKTCSDVYYNFNKLSGVFNGFNKINVALLYSPTHYIIIYLKVSHNLNIWNTR